MSGAEVCGLGADSSSPQPINPNPRLGCLPYLNVKPLVYTFEHGGLPEGWELVYATPSELAGMLGRREIDVAPVSSFAYLANSDFGYVPGICISSFGAVETVLMLSKVPAGEVRTVAADISSLSGRAMLRIVLAENFGVAPEFVDAPPELDSMLARHDAALMIGNPAMLADKTGLHVIDLGEEWLKLTGLPAVFALWAGPKASISHEIAVMLQKAKEIGVGCALQAAEEEAKVLGLPFEMCANYLTKVIRYDLGPEEEESLEVFRRKAILHGLIGGVV